MTHLKILFSKMGVSWAEGFSEIRYLELEFKKMVFLKVLKIASIKNF